MQETGESGFWPFQPEAVERHRPGDFIKQWHWCKLPQTGQGEVHHHVHTDFNTFQLLLKLSHYSTNITSYIEYLNPIQTLRIYGVTIIWKQHFKLFFCIPAFLFSSQFVLCSELWLYNFVLDAKTVSPFGVTWLYICLIVIFWAAGWFIELLTLCLKLFSSRCLALTVKSDRTHNSNSWIGEKCTCLALFQNPNVTSSNKSLNKCTFCWMGQETVTEQREKWLPFPLFIFSTSILIFHLFLFILFCFFATFKHVVSTPTFNLFSLL